MKRTTTTKPIVSFKCHYCGGGRHGTSTAKKTTTPSKSLERDRRIVSGNAMARSKSVNGNNFFPPIHKNNGLDYTYVPGSTLTEDDVREDLIQLKRKYGLLAKEQVVLKTHLQVATNDLKKRELEIESLLQDPVVLTKSQEQLELNSLKRKTIQNERALREKSEEISKLMNDKNILNALENRQKLEKLEKDYGKLQYRLDKSVPHAELEAEKIRLSELIESLQRENNEMHQILSTFFQDTENGIYLDGTGIRDAKLLERMKEEATARRNEVDYYQKALVALIKDKSSHLTSMPDTYATKTDNKHHHTGHSLKNEKLGKFNGEKTLNIVQKSNKMTLPNIPRKSSQKYDNNKKMKLATEKEQITVKPMKLESFPSKQISAKPSIKQTPVKKISNVLKYEESESSVATENFTSNSENDEHKENATPKRAKTEENSAGYLSNHQFDQDSNINAIADEYREQQEEIDDRTETILTALQCQLLREEMLQTRVTTF